MNNISIKNSLNTQQLMIVNGEFDKKKKSKTTAWLLWLFLGGFAAHRFYTGNNTGLAVAMLLLNWLTLGIWALVDAFFINSNLEKKNEEIEGEILSRFVVSE